MRAIVTGAGGFVGTALIKELASRGVSVIAVVRNEHSRIAEIQDLFGVQIVCSDMADLNTLHEKIPKGDGVFYHLAWSGSTGPMRGDYQVQLQNVKWTLDAVNAAFHIGCTRFVGAGTLAEMDVDAYTPLDGATPNKVSCYGAAKIAAHYMSKAECASLGISNIWAHLPNTFGKGNYTMNFINFAVKTLLTNKPADFTSGEQFYDFVHISDVAKGLRCLGESGKSNCSYYIGSGQARPLKEYITLLRDEIDPNIQLHLGAVAFNGVMHPASVFDCSKTTQDTGYSPGLTFIDGLRKTIPWLEQQIEEGAI